MKSVDLKIRPLHHHRPDRVRAHVFLCLLAYYVEWHMRKALAPILFDDHEREATEQEGYSVVAAAGRFRAAGTESFHRLLPEGHQPFLVDVGGAHASHLAHRGCHFWPSRREY